MTLLDCQIRFLAKRVSPAIEQLKSRREAIKSRVKVLITQRQELQKELRRLTWKDNRTAVGGVKDQIGQLSQEFKKLRKKMVLCDGIAVRSKRVWENRGQRFI